jgi:hypothetical protein
MAAQDTIAGVMDFLASYSKAFEAYDTKAIVDHYVFPCTIIGDAESLAPLTFKAPETLSAGVDYILSLHREIGVKTGQRMLLDITELSPRLAGMMIRTRFRDGHGNALYDVQGFYSLARTGDGFRILAISHNQLPRLLACAGRPSVSIT